MKYFRNQLLLVFFFFMFLVSYSVNAQSQGYGDVAVIVNDNDSTSLEIAEYYAQAHGISANRILHVQVPVSEETDSLGFEDLRAQIEAELMVGGLLDTVNYLVTTKGLPFRVSINGACDSLSQSGISTLISKCTCVENELALILGPNSSYILGPTAAPNPYFGREEAFSRDSFGIFLVSRLDGFTLADVKQMIDRGGEQQTYYAPESEFLLDIFKQNDSIFSDFIENNEFTIMSTQISNLGIQVNRDFDSDQFLGNQTDLVGSVYYGIDTVGVLSLSYQPGAMAFAGNSFSVNSFVPNNQVHNEDVCGRLVGRGVANVVGFVAPYFYSLGAKPANIFEAYLDTSRSVSANAAMAFYSASVDLSLQGLLIGDPKTQLRGTPFASNREQISLLNDLELYPNPNNGNFKLRGIWTVNSDIVITIMNSNGQVLLSENRQGRKGEFEYEFNLAELPAGMYYMNIRQGEQSQSEKFVVIPN